MQYLLTKERKALAPKVPKKRINTVKKGDKNEHKTAQLFRSNGFFVIVSPRQSWENGHAVKKANDFFNLWDCIAVKQTNKNEFKFNEIDIGETVFIQVKTNKMPPKAYIDKLKEFNAKYKFLVIWHDRKKECEVIKI